jgi:hypothetical protein
MVPTQKLATVGWLFVIALVSGFGAGSAIKPVQIPFSIVHKLSAVACLVVIVLRIANLHDVYKAQSSIFIAISIFAAAILLACVTGVVHSLPSQAGPLWLNLHRVAAAASTIACGVGARLVVLSTR